MRPLALLTLLANVGAMLSHTTQHGQPILKLPYGSWQATKYDEKADVYTFRNIRYAAPPTGSRRFAKPEPPLTMSRLQDGSWGPSCIPVAPPTPTGTAPSNSPTATSSTHSEDCLFLDLYVPGNSFRESKRHPVVVYIHGGSYTGGSKQDSLATGIFDGTGIVYQADQNAIVVTINYRLGAFGWLGGSTAEAEGITNLGLRDQRAALKWVQEYIHLVRGDPNDVSLWGESAGAGSILHHLVQKGGRRDPLFHRAVIQSPGFVYSFDRKGRIDNTVKLLADQVGCADASFDCLRNVSVGALETAQYALGQDPYAAQVSGFGPVPDGDLIPDVPAVGFASGRYWKHLDSLIVSHTSNEGLLFVDSSIRTDEDTTTFLKGLFREEEAAALIEGRYPPINSPNANYTDQKARLIAIVGDSTFLCNCRWVSDAFQDRAYNVQWSVGTGVHGSDIPATWFNPTLFIEILGQNISVADLLGHRGLYQGYQSYLVSHTRKGNPNVYRNATAVPPTIGWPLAGNRTLDMLTALNVTDDGFQLIKDQQTSRHVCDFWRDLYIGLAKRWM
ncbi:Alpha/Beta hydrolase protein [Aspergillus pseudodeflectus]|uniref:Alpha/Beta hydrolase protein n=1 Tax=Aspergillus pseudodeflectus TaxID=176178 RepID=A0ABR4KIY2_9EURO